MGFSQQFTYGVVREGVTAENFPQISAKFPQTFRRISAPFPGAIKCISLQISANFPQNFRKNPFANDPISELLIFVGPTMTRTKSMRHSLNRNLSWGFPLGNLLPKTRVLKHRVLERKHRPNANASVSGTQRFRTLSVRLQWVNGGPHLWHGSSIHGRGSCVIGHHMGGVICSWVNF